MLPSLLFPSEAVGHGMAVSEHRLGIQSDFDCVWLLYKPNPSHSLGQFCFTESRSVLLYLTHLHCIYHLNAAETTEILTDFSPANQRPAGTFPPLCTALINTLVSLISTSPRLPASSQFSPAGTPDGSRSVIFFTCIPDGDLSLLVASQLPPVAAVASSPRE